MRRILFGLVEDRCREMGLREGDVLRCRSRDHDGVLIELSSGELARMDLAYAWFVEVEPVASDGA